MSILRIGGIASGFDTEQIVRDLMRVERMKVDKLYQNRQIIEWKREQFRESINSVRSFRDNFFNVLKPQTNMMSASSLKHMQASISSDSGSYDPGSISVSATSEAMAGVSTFQVIQSATAASAAKQGVTEGSSEGARLELSDTMAVVSGKLKSEFGGFLFDEGDGSYFTLKINGEDIIVNKTDSLKTVIDKINNSKAGVQVSYSAFSDTFTVTAKATGAGHLTTDDGGNFFTALGITVTGGNIGDAGRDAIFEVNGFEGSRSGNTFTIDGISYSINKKIDEADNSPLVNVSVAVDVEAVYNNVKQFIDGYNSLLDELNGRLNEERFKDFFPLTDEQKEGMSEKEIEKWEEKAKSGLLRREPALENMLRDMRRALSDLTGNLHLSEIGIETSRIYQEQGKLVLKGDGSALKAAIAGNPEKVAEIFTKRSDIAYSPNLTAEQRAQRYEESGLAHRLSDILNDNIRTTRDNSGRKGILLERAGIEGDITQFNNYLDRQIKDVNKRIDRVNEMLIRKEEQYYRQFAAMEKALQQLYSQGDWLTMQMNQLNR